MIPPKLPFADTCLTVPYYVAAYHALSEIGLVTQQDNVLIHDGASRLGQALLGLLASRGVTKIWTTAATGEESMWLSESLGLSEAAIIPENWFSFNSSASSQWKQKFSLMISEAEGGSSSLLMSYGKPDGRNVMSQADPTSANSTQPGNAQNS
ncbi:hypothetical protein B0T17DRAFT_619928 [Bombardia bombarda]|uniref:Uncharacterized protein n=1 Tax=Bombardia bombarda TaxID=252184 RepID=A0AA40BVG2_9PEZI|nr:hypothetical protein B0T17DRAFT_619928 [Bombardia bombarda]